jgi:hypothetical protein
MNPEILLYIGGALICVGLAIRWAYKRVCEFTDTMRSFHNYGD